MKTILILLFSFFAFQTLETPGLIGTRSVNTDYFWNNNRNAKLLQSKSNILIETVKNGYYSEKEYLTFIDKKLNSIKYIKNGDTITVSTIASGNGYLISNFRDTVYIANGKLNGKSYFYSYYALNMATPRNQKINFSKDQDRFIMDFKDNFLKSMLVYRKGILIYETYFKKYDFIKENLDKGKEDFRFRDSVLNVFNSNGSLRSTAKYRNGVYIK